MKKKVFLMTAFVALALSAPAFAVDMDYNSDTNTGTNSSVDNSTTVTPNTDGTMSTTTKHHYRKKKTSKTYSNSNGVNNDNGTLNNNVSPGMTNGGTNNYDNGQPGDVNQPANQ